MDDRHDGLLGMMIATIELSPKNGQREAMLEIFRFVEERARMKSDCMGCGVFEAADGTQRVLYVELWGSAREMHAHIQTGLYLHILNAMELAAEEPRINFHEVGHTHSMELIEELRSVRKGNTYVE